MILVLTVPTVMLFLPVMLPLHSHRNRHHWDDVAAGAAIGILSTELSYWLGSKLWPNNKENLQVSVTPTALQIQYKL